MAISKIDPAGLDLTGDLTVDTNTLVVDADNNRVGVGTDIPSTNLEVLSATTNTSVSITNSSSYLNLQSNSNDGYINLAGSGNLIFRTGTPSVSEKMRLDSSGHLIAPNGVTLGTAVGTYSAANTLDDYEEGTWTPVIYGSTTAGTASYSTRQASYTKIGNLVNVSFYISGTFSSAPSGSINVSGLPFNSLSAANNLGYPSTKGAISWTASGYTDQIYAYVVDGVSYIGFGITRDNDSLIGANFSTHMSTSNFQMHLHLTYRAA